MEEDKAPSVKLSFLSLFVEEGNFIEEEANCVPFLGVFEISKEFDPLKSAELSEEEVPDCRPSTDAGDAGFPSESVSDDIARKSSECVSAALVETVRTGRGESACRPRELVLKDRLKPVTDIMFTAGISIVIHAGAG